MRKAFLLGTAILSIFTAILTIVSCGGGGDGDGVTPDPGMLKLYIDPQPIPGIESLELHVSRIDVVLTSEPDGPEEVLTISDTPTTIAMVGLQGLTPNLVGLFQVPKDGFIKQIRLIIGDGTAKINGVEMPVKIPSGPQTGEKIISADTIIEIREPNITSVTTRVDVEKSLIQINNQVIMKPVLRAVLGEVTSLPISEFEEGKIIVFFKEGVTEEEVMLLNQEIGAMILSADPEIGKYTIVLPPTITVREAQTFYEASPLVDFALPNYKGLVSGTVVPNDPFFIYQWAMNNTGQTGGRSDADIDAPEAWAVQTGSRGIIVAVLDTGVNRHPDLTDNLFANPWEIPGNYVDDDNNGYVDDIRGWNTITHTQGVSGKFFYGTDVTDIYGHGTPVAGIIGAVGNNNYAVVGVNWQVTILPVKVLLDNGNGYVDDYIEGIQYAQKAGAHILNASLRFMTADAADYNRLVSAFNRVNSDNILHVVAAGNEGVNIDTATTCIEWDRYGTCLYRGPLYFFPAGVDADNVITIAATTHDDSLLNSSNYGPGVDIAAPGSSIHTTNALGGISLFSQTSAATPFVSGAAALVLAQHPSLIGNPIGTKDRILNGADRIGLSVAKGRRLNLLGALQ